MVQRGDDLMTALKAISDKATRIPQADQGFLSSLRRIDESFTLVDATPELEQRDKTYFVVPENQLANPSFVDDLTSWTETIDGGITATTARDTAQAKTLFGSLTSLKIDMTASTGAGDAKRTQAVTAAATEAWSFEVWAYAPTLTNCKAVLQIEWLDGGASVLATETVEITAINSAFALIQLENEVAPSSTAQVRVSLILEATGSGGVGTAYFDLARAEQNKTTVTDREDRFIVGEAVVTT